MNIDKNLVLSSVNQKKALVFFVRKKLFRPIYIGNIKKFTGYQSFMWFKSKGYESFEINMEMEDGEATIVLVQKDQYYILGENNCNNLKNLELNKGWFKIKLIGENASLKFKVERHSK